MEIYYQHDSMDCGPTCLRMIARHYGKKYSLKYLRENSYITREGVSLLGLSDAAAKIGLKTLCAKITMNQLFESMPLPCILFWNGNHFVVCYDVKGKGDNKRFCIADPALGKVEYSGKEMLSHWISGKLDGEDIGIAMQIEPGVNFYHTDGEEIASPVMGSMLSFLRYVTPHRKTIFQILFGTVVAMVLGYSLPFISQSVVDIGIKNRDLNFIFLMMIVQLVISVSQVVIQFVQSWLSLHMNTLIDLNLLSDYLAKLTRMPLRFFEIKTLGDIMQRIGDHSRIKSFLMNNFLDILFSSASFAVFSIVLAIYNWKILSIFIIGNSLYVIWILIFLRYRRELDNKYFIQSSKAQNNMVQFIQGMQEVKINNIAQQKLWEWEHIQIGLYKINTRALKLGQIQSTGSLAFSSVTGILISYIAARMVVTGEITLGMMMSLSFIIGQISAPIASLIGFIKSYQDAKISFERLNEINSQDDEMKDDDKKYAYLPEDRDLVVDNVSFSYSGADRNYVLDEVNLTIPQNKVTAIVGASGCGKTTLLKMLQGMYVPNKGMIRVGPMPLCDLKPKFWRSHIGAVMQDGFIFSDTIAGNVTLDFDNIDENRMRDAIDKVNLMEYVSSLPLNFNTKIGDDGIGLSQGQKQRILLARVIYKNPDYVFLDEATNALDTDNECRIMRNLRDFYVNKTVVVAAHRLSTIRDADKIIVMDKGRIVEQGTHDELIALKKHYYSLVQSQIELVS